MINALPHSQGECLMNPQNAKRPVFCVTQRGPDMWKCREWYKLLVSAPTPLKVPSGQASQSFITSRCTRCAQSLAI
jgi:hypothetical protein